MKEEYKPLIDSRNADLWQDMNDHFNISLEDSPEPNYISNYSDSEITISVDPANIDSAPFTHELLHLYIKSKNTYILWDLKQMTEEDPVLHNLLSNSMVNHICNSLEHYKMLPIFLDRGYDRKDFVKDFDKPLMDPQQMQKLKESYIKDGIHDGETVQTLIRKFFSMKSSSNNAFDYGPYYKELFELDPQLFSALENLWNNWLKFDIGNPEWEYITMFEKFLSEMRDWIGEKRLVY